MSVGKQITLTARRFIWKKRGEKIPKTNSRWKHDKPKDVRNEASGLYCISYLRKRFENRKNSRQDPPPEYAYRKNAKQANVLLREAIIR